MSSIRARLERLERRHPAGTGVIEWDNLWRRREDIIPDGIIDWEALHMPWEPWSPENCPIERAIAAAGIPAPRTNSDLSGRAASEDSIRV